MSSAGSSLQADCPEHVHPEDAKVEWMNPSTIKFSQDTCSPVFTRKLLQRNKSASQERKQVLYSEALKSTPVLSLKGTLQQLRDGLLKVDDIPLIRVIKHEDAFYSLDNRRLWVFREYGELIPVQVCDDDSLKEFFRKLTRTGDGETINVTDKRDKEIEVDKQTLESIVLQWSVDDILNQRMYVNKVVDIPDTFPELHSYYPAFRWPLVDETRGQVEHGLESIGSAPYLLLSEVEEKKNSSAHKGLIRKLTITTQAGRNCVQRNTKSAPWKPKPTDLLVLSTVVPESVDDFNRSAELYTLALITSEELFTTDKKEAVNDDSPLSFKVTAYLPTESPEYKEILQGEKSWYAVLLGNLATARRIWGALHPDLGDRDPAEDLLHAPERELVQETLYSHPQEFMICARANRFGDGLEAAIEKYCNFCLLNASQTEAVRSTIMGLVNGEACRVRLIQGPPGTGKTSTVVAFVSIISCLKDRIIVCAPTNRAISEVAERYLHKLQEALATGIQFPHFTSPGMTFCRALQVGDVVMVGNEDRMETDGILGQIFLPHRVERLLQALGPNSGWRYTSQLLVYFLEGGACTEHEAYVQQWHKHHEEDSVFLDFLQFVRKRLHVLGTQMMRHGHVMTNDLPSKMLDADARELIADSCVLLEEVLESLRNENFRDKDVLECFEASSKAPNFNNGKTSTALHAFWSKKSKLLELMSRRPGYILEVSGPAVYTPWWIENSCLKYSCLLFSTTSSAGRWCVKESGAFEYAVIDEAAQLVEAETAIVTQLTGINQALLVGDPKQLEALVTSQVAKDAGYGRSLFERLQKLGHPCHLLDVQYRMHPAISRFPNKQFYGGKVTNGPNVTSVAYEKSCQDLFGPYAFVDVKDGEETFNESAKSWENRVEAEVVQCLIRKFRAGVADKSQPLDVGVIAPYKSQVEFLAKRLSHFSAAGASKAEGQDFSCQVDVKTVDGFQGGEKDVILFTAVRANVGGHIGFVEDPRRLNVALTRGRYCVFIIGHASTLAAGNTMWHALIEDAKRRKCYQDARNDPDLKKIILRVKNELEEIASLMKQDSILFYDTPWKVIFTGDFKNSIMKMKSKQCRKTIIYTVLKLAQGHRSPYPTKCSLASEAYTRMIHRQPSADFNLVWTIDVEKGGDQNRQIIKIWDAVDSSFLQGLIRRLEAGFAAYTPAYIDRCSTTKFNDKSRKLVVPARWKDDPSFIWYQASPKVKQAALSSTEEHGPEPLAEQHLEKANVDESILLMKFYPLTSGIAKQLLKASDGSKLELLFEVNEEEAAIIDYPFSTFILGRSGTGKTTVITTKLLKLEQQFRSINGLLNSPVNKIDANQKGDGMETSSMEDETKLNPVNSDHLRQAIVTLSPKLCAAIKNHIEKTSRTMLAADCPSAEISEDREEDVMLDEEAESKLMGGIPDTLVNIQPAVFPLVITYRKFLAMIDGSVLCPFLRQRSNLLHDDPADENVCCPGSESSSSDTEERNECEGGQNQSSGDSDKCPDEDDEDDEDEFGIFSTDGDLADEDADTAVTLVTRQQRGDPGTISSSRVEVTFEHFIYHYWPHFNQAVIKRCDSSVVFTEILSFIKGSLETLHTSNGRLSREQYKSMASKRTSNFDEQQRDSIYSIFLVYERMKSKRMEYDIADYSMHLYQQMKHGNYVGLKFHYVYVDEVQDLTMVQIALFKYVCLNIQEGYVFAGDTAQTIARGVSFRFQDIRHLFYTEFLGRGKTCLENRQAASNSNSDGNEDLDPLSTFDPGSSSKCPTSGRPSVEKQGLTAHMPDLHHLTHNFRTHVGIVNIANSIVQLLLHFFPNAVDRLDPESSLIHGDAPVFLETEATHETVTSLFGHGGAAGGGGCDFGAEQVILVRNIEAKQDMIKKLGKRGLVMSVLDCKGLEFKDVLLYNFFTDSLLDSKWRVIYSYMAENAIGEQNGRQLTFPNFNLQKHNLLMSELKQLYVVVTRARQRLWIYDENPDCHMPMLDFWRHSELVQVKHLDDDLIKTIHGKSTPEEWRKRGIQMFNDHHYDMSELSFERAGDLNRAKWARAAGLQQTGERLVGSDLKAAAQHFRESAELFLQIEKGESAAKCHTKFGDYRKAGYIYRDSCKPPRLEEAGDSFMTARCWQEAVDAYAESSCYRQCLAACLRGKLFDVGAQLLSRWEEQRKTQNPHLVDTNLKSSGGDTQVDDFENVKMDYLKKCALHYHSQRNATSMMKFVGRFPSTSSQKVFLKRRDYFELLIGVEEAEGNFAKAAEMAEMKGDLKLAASLLEKGGCPEQAIEKLLEHARFDMTWSEGKHGWPLEASSASLQLLQSARGIVNTCAPSIQAHLVQEVDLLQSLIGGGLENWAAVRDLPNFHLQYIAGRQAIDDLRRHMSLTVTGEAFSGLLSDLVLIWDEWSEKLISVIDALNRGQRRRDTVEDEKLIETSNRFLSVVKHAQPHLFLVTDAAVTWVEKDHVTLLPNQGQRCQVASALLFTWAEAFWAKQLWQVGLEVVKLLEQFHSAAADQKFLPTTYGAKKILQKDKVLCSMYCYAETLLKILSRNAITEGTHDLESRLQLYGGMIYQKSFPFWFDKGIVRHDILFREQVGAIYDSIANKIWEGAGVPGPPYGKTLRFESWGRIQILLPYLSKQWIRTHGPEVIDGMPKSVSWPALWKCMHAIYGNGLEDSGKPDEKTCEHWLEVITRCWNPLKKIYDTSRETISPLMFMQIMERILVMDLACHTHLHSFILPEAWVTNYMTGTSNQEVYTCLLNMRCNGACKNYALMWHILRWILDLLNSSTYQVEAWFDKAHMKWSELLPSLIFRFLVAVLTACINTQDRQIWDMTVKVLRVFFRENSPLLTGIPKAFLEELVRVFQRQPQDHQVKMAFMRAMATTESPLVVLKQGGKHIHQWAYSCRIRSMVINQTRAKRGKIFATEYSKAEGLDSGISSVSSQNGILGENSLPGQEAGLVDDALESVKVLLRASALVLEEEKKREEEEEREGDNMDTSEVADGSMDDYSLESQMMPEGHVSVGEDETVPVYVKTALLLCLKHARQRLKEELSPTERYRRDCQTWFRQRNIKSKEYLEFFLSEACPLKAAADDWLQILESSFHTLKDVSKDEVNNDEEQDDGLYDDIADSQEILQKDVAIMDPRNKVHMEEDLTALEVKVRKFKELMETSKEKLQTRIHKLGGDTNKGRDNMKAKEIPTTPGTNRPHNQLHPGKKKQQKKKKKGRR